MNGFINTKKDFMLYLASQSPRRKELFSTFNIPFKILPPDPNVDMEALEEQRVNEAPLTYVKRVTQAKLQQAQSHTDINDSVLCADTVVCLGQEIFGKPHNATNNAVILRRLQGNTHRVLTAIALYHNHKTYTAVCVSKITFGLLDEATIQAYSNSQEGWDKAGGYAIQGKAAAFIQSIHGNYTGVVGLPLWHTRELLLKSGILTTEHS
jgi:septum formation protein